MGDFDTFGDLQERVRDGIADHTDTFFAPVEFRTSLNEAMWEIFKIVHAANCGFFFNLTPETITLTSSTNFYTLTDKFAWIDELRPVNPDAQQMKFYYMSRHNQTFRDLLALETDTVFANSDEFYFDVVSENSFVVVPKPAQPFDVYVYKVQEPDEMTANGDIPPMRPSWRPLMVQYAVRKLKNKQETGEYMSDDKLLGFLLDNLSKYIKPRAGTNAPTVEDYCP